MALADGPGLWVVEAATSCGNQYRKDLAGEGVSKAMKRAKALAKVRQALPHMDEQRTAMPFAVVGLEGIASAHKAPVPAKSMCRPPY